jgi:hypothetical protein
MTEHIDVRYCIRGEVQTDDSKLLDTIESELPNASEVTLGAEYSANRIAEAEDLADREERLSARMTFAGESKEVNGTTVTPHGAAKQVFTKLTTHNLASKASDWYVEMYRTPEGAVTADNVQAYYEEYPDEQPTDGNGESYVPSSWDPTNHVEMREEA